MTDREANPMHSVERQPKPFRAAPRCRAKTRRGEPCLSSAVSGKARCRMHGGAKGSGAPKGVRNGAYKHGIFMNEAKKTRAECQDLVRECHEILLMASKIGAIT